MGAEETGCAVNAGDGDELYTNDAEDWEQTKSIPSEKKSGFVCIVELSCTQKRNTI